jgi:hypothetical protein
VTLIADSLDDVEGKEAFDALRSARRRNRIAHLEWFDAFYKAYISALFSAIAIYVAAGWFGDASLTPRQVVTATQDGPAWLGLIVAAVLVVGLRSGGRGGPLAFEQADVRHVLLSPVDRRHTIRRPALRHLRHSLFIGASVGAALGLVAGRRMPEHPAEWVALLGITGAATTLLGSGAAMVASGLRMRTWMTDLLSLAIVGWAALDVTQQLETSPMTWIGNIAFLPLDVDVLAVAGLLVAVAISIWGLMVSNRCSIEAAERRSRLVGQMRFAATLQDVRTVMILQRQLAQEQTRQRPWVRLPRSKRPGYKALRKPTAKGETTRVLTSVFVRRGLHGILRWPAIRYGRLVVLIGIAALSTYGVWQGTGPLVVVAGAATWLAALDLCESLAQEVDHPDRLRSTSHESGVVLVQHLFVPFVVMVVLVMLGAVPFAVLGDADVVGSLWPVTMFVAAGAVSGAALTANAKPAAPGGMLETAETASLKFAIRTLVPPGIAIAGFAPIVLAKREWDRTHVVGDMVGATNLALIIVMVCCIGAYSWIRYSENFQSMVVDAHEDQKKRDAEKAAKKEAAAPTEAVPDEEPPKKQPPKNQPSKNASKKKKKGSGKK